MRKEPFAVAPNVMPGLERLRVRIAPLKHALLHHALYREIRSLAALRCFMEHHVFAVWDFMSLLKTLQHRLCCVTVPWLPAADPRATRFLNAMVLAEECDADGRGGYLSHFELYMRSMKDCGADTRVIERVLSALRQGCSVADALAADDVPPCVRSFVRHTFAVIEAGDLCAIAGAFTFGREDLLPALFQRVVEELDDQSDGELEDFRYYLQRHIGLDGDEHGPMAVQLLESLCGSDERQWQAAEQAAVQALQARQDLWDGVLAALRHRQLAPEPEA